MSRQAGLAEQADAALSKSAAREGMWVQVPHPAHSIFYSLMSLVGGTIHLMNHIRSDDVVVSALAQSDRGTPDAENAARHGISVKTIRRWRLEYQVRGRSRGQAHTSAACPQCQGGTLDDGAYAELLGWYLGDGHIVEGRRGVFSLQIYNDQQYVEDNERLLGLIRAVKPNGRPHSRHKTGCVVTTAAWKHWPCLFPQHGPGRKHTRPIVLDTWQQEIVARHAAGFLRGLFHSDGCRAKNWTRRTLSTGEVRRYEYPRWQFSNRSSDIRLLCCRALDAVGVPWRRSNDVTISVSTCVAVARLDELIGPKR